MNLDPDAPPELATLTDAYAELQSEHLAVHLQAARAAAVRIGVEAPSTAAEQIQVQVSKLRPADGDILLLTVVDDGTLGQEALSQAARLREQLVRSLSDVRLAGCWVLAKGAKMEFTGPEELKAGGRCPICGELGQWKAMALCCPRHGRFLG